MKTDRPTLARPRRIAAATIALLAPCSSCGERKPPAPPPPTVLVTPVVREHVALYTDSVGTLVGYIDADIRARVAGYLRTQKYADGTKVKAGQLLFTIEPTEYLAGVASAKATRARAQALEINAKTQFQRAKSLFDSGSIASQELDNARAAQAETGAQVAAATAALEQAQLDLSYTQVRSPIDGTAGLALLRVGNLVGQGEPTLLTVVSDIDPIRANFTTSEIDYVRYPDRFKHFEGRDVAWARAQFAKLDAGGTADGGDPGVELGLADGSSYPHRGVIVAADRQVDPSTGTIKLQALFPNPGGTLKPGQFARVRLKHEGDAAGALVVPEKALIALQGTFSVGVVGPDSKVQIRRVELAPGVRGMRVVKNGVNEGERVVVEGTQKITEGAIVAPQPAPPPPPTPPPPIPHPPPAGAPDAPAPKQ